MFKNLVFGLFAMFAMSATAQEVPIVGTVESKCVVVVDTLGVYGNPTPSTLSTQTASGGVEPVVRYDVIQADYYKAVISVPNSFSESPELDDVVNFTGTVIVKEVSDPLMSAYSEAQINYENVTEINLTVPGSTWFSVSSTATYGFDKALPAGVYRGIVSAECIAL